jgi:nucleotide-binding universal stress UspA family protein
MYKHILFPYDGSELSRKAEGECVAFAKLVGARVTAMHVLPYPDVHRARGGMPAKIRRLAADELESAAKAEARSMLSEVETRTRAIGVDCDTALALDAEPYKAIIERAETTGCDLIIMASYRRAPLDALLHGSEAMKVLRHCRIPVLVVPTK